MKETVMHISTLNSISSNANGVMRFALGESSVGSILVAKSGQGVCAILLGDDRHVLVQELRGRFPQCPLVEGREDLQRHVAEVITFVDTPAKASICRSICGAPRFSGVSGRRYATFQWARPPATLRSPS